MSTSTSASTSCRADVDAAAIVTANSIWQSEEEEVNHETNSRRGQHLYKARRV